MDSLNTRLPIRPNDSRHRGDRKILNNNLYLFSNTIGTSTFYPLKIIDISESGMKLKWHSDYEIPYIKNTLIEIKVRLEIEDQISEEYCCLAKIVRTDDMNANERFFGVKIIFMDKEGKKSWISTLEGIH